MMSSFDARTERELTDCQLTGVHGHVSKSGNEKHVSKARTPAGLPNEEGAGTYQGQSRGVWSVTPPIKHEQDQGSGFESPSMSADSNGMLNGTNSQLYRIVDPTNIFAYYRYLWQLVEVGAHSLRGISTFVEEDMSMKDFENLVNAAIMGYSSVDIGKESDASWLGVLAREQRLSAKLWDVLIECQEGSGDDLLGAMEGVVEVHMKYLFKRSNAYEHRFWGN